MIVPMKKVSLIISGDKKDETLKTLRKLGIIHIEIAEGSGERLVELREQIALLESAVFTIGKKKNTEQKDASATEAFSVANEIKSLDEEKKQCQAERVALSSELDRLKIWGDIDPDSIGDLEAKGIKVSFYEMPRPEYEALPDSYWINHITSTFVETLRWWIDNGKKESPETITKYFDKGNQILINGKIQTNKYTDKDGNNRTTTDIVVDDFEFLGTTTKTSDPFKEFAQDLVEESLV